MVAKTSADVAKGVDYEAYAVDSWLAKSVCWPPLAIDDHCGICTVACEVGCSLSIFSPSAASVTSVVDTAPVADLAFVAHGTIGDLPSAPVINVPVSSGSCVSHPAS